MMGLRNRRPVLADLLQLFGLLIVLAQGSKNPVFTDFWHDVCGALGGDESPAPGPLKAQGYKFMGLSMLVRHGARNFLDDPRTSCSPPYPPPSTNEAVVPPFLQNQTIPKRVSPIGLSTFPHSDPALVKVVSESPGLHNDTRCLGCLLKQAKFEFNALGKEVRKNYFPALPSHPKLESAYLYSTNVSRNIASLFLVLGGMFPEIKNKPPMQFHSRAFYNDMWASTQHCPSGVMKSVSNRTLPPWRAGFARRWYEATGQNFTWKCHDPMVSAHCSGGRFREVLGLPPGQDSPIMQEAFEALAELYIARFVEHKEAWRLLCAPNLLELNDILQKQASGNGPPVAVWSTQDVVIVGMLETLGIWDKVWSQWSEAVIFEVYTSEKHSNRHYFRLLRRGEPVPACRHPTPEGLCDLDTWLPDDVLALRNEDLWTKKCTPAPGEHYSLWRDAPDGLDAAVFDF